MAEKIDSKAKLPLSRLMEAVEQGEQVVIHRPGGVTIPLAVRQALGVKLAAAASQRAFFDSNILLYADDARYEEKQRIANALILECRQRDAAVLSIQILQEYYSNATRKLKLDACVARSKVEIYSRFQLVEPAAADVLAAIDLSRLNMISYYDAAIVQCARKAGCAILYSEDMQHGQWIEGVQIVNPFL